MKRGSKLIIVITAAITVALIGLISLQVTLLVDSYRQKEQAFDRNVLNALNSVALRIEKDEAASKIFNVAMTLPPPIHGKPTKNLKKFFLKTDKRYGQKRDISWIVSDTHTSPGGKQMRVEVFHSSGIDTMSAVITEAKSGKKGDAKSFSYSYSTDDNEMRIRSNFGDSAMIILRDTTKKRRGEIVAQVVDKLFLIETLPIEQRLDLSKLDSLIKSSLKSVGIGMDYSFRVLVGEHDSVKISSDSVKVKEVRSAPFRTRLFPNDVLSPRYELALFLPEKSSFVLSEMALLLAMSLLFVSIIVVSFIYTIRVIVLQKRFSLSIVDFINNMTHEFKTPISTIALASEAIAKPEVLKSRPKVLKYNSLIVDENNRMKHQVEKILQMAVLEEGEFELKRTDVNVHSVILQAVKNISLQVEQRNGSVELALNGKEHIVNGDIVHLANIIHNVLDNAVKYSSGIPAVRIETKNLDRSIVISIGDNGIGISKEDVVRVFEKYYRVSTGNTHDVKGFGLGLSYVKLVTEAHNGTVSLSSIPGKGTTVEIVLPV